MIDITESWMLQKTVQTLTDANILSFRAICDRVIGEEERQGQRAGNCSAVRRLLERMKAEGYAENDGAGNWTLTR